MPSRGNILRRPAIIPDSSLSYAAAVRTFLACGLSAAAVPPLTFGLFSCVCPASANPNRNIRQVIRLPANKADRGEAGSIQARKEVEKSHRRENDIKNPSKYPKFSRLTRVSLKLTDLAQKQNWKEVKGKTQHEKVRMAAILIPSCGSALPSGWWSVA